MKTIVHIPDMSPGEEKLRELISVYPEGRQRERSFGVWLDQNDPRVPRVLDCLHRLGYRRWEQGDMDFSREYSLNLIREYEPADFEHVEYLEFWPPDMMDRLLDCERDEQGRLRLERPTLKNARRTGWDFASANLGRILVLQRVRDLLMEVGFRHLSFRPTVLVTGRGLYAQRCTPIPWEQFKVTQPWWELHSELVLPPVSPSMDLRDWDGKPVRPGDCSNGCVPREGSYNHAELHYLRSDLAAVGPFDAALSFEHYHAHNPEDTRQTIVSKRFYDFCVENGLKGRWAPVRIEES